MVFIPISSAFIIVAYCPKGKISPLLSLRLNTPVTAKSHFFPAVYPIFQSPSSFRTPPQTSFFVFSNSICFQKLFHVFHFLHIHYLQNPVLVFIYDHTIAFNVSSAQKYLYNICRFLYCTRELRLQLSSFPDFPYTTILFRLGLLVALGYFKCFENH